jgi:hypothetical protein
VESKIGSVQTANVPDWSFLFESRARQRYYLACGLVYLCEQFEEVTLS